MIAEGSLPMPELVGAFIGARFDNFYPVWADENCLWVEIRYEKPIKMNNVDTFQPMWTFVKYDITSEGFKLVFCDLEAEL